MMQDVGGTTWRKNQIRRVARFTTIEAGAEVTVTCGGGLSYSKTTHADMSVNVSFRLLFLPWLHNHESYDFYVLRGGDGKLHWMPES